MRIPSTALLPLLASTPSCLGFSLSSFAAPRQSLARKCRNYCGKPNFRDHHHGHVISSSSLSVSSSTTSSTEVGAPGTANLPWSELGFEIRPTKSHLRMVYKNGKWEEAELVEVGALDMRSQTAITMGAASARLTPLSFAHAWIIPSMCP